MADGMPCRETKLYGPLGALVVVGLICLWRLMVLITSDVNLAFDEAQYWYWAQDLTFGYFSKPPLIAWVIAATTSLFGESEVAVKLGALVANGGTAFVLYFLGRRLYGTRAGFWSAVVFITLPAVSFSSMIISVDPFLLFFWALGLLFLHNALESGETKWWAALGAVVGFGFLAKYAMAFFVLNMVVFLIWSKDRRPLLRSGKLWLALGLALAIYLPNFFWNASHDFITFAHTKANANLSQSLFHLDKGLEFIGSQFGVFGPLLFGLLLILMLRARSVAAEEREKFLLSFIMPVLLIMMVQGFLSRANPNWAAPVYVAATVLVVGWVCTKGRWWLVQVSVVLHMVLAAAFYNIESILPLVGQELSPKTDLLKRTRGWASIADAVADIHKDNPDAKLLFDARKVMAPLLYYITPHPFDSAMWNQDVVVTNHYEMTMDIKDRVGETFLLITEEPNPNHIAPWFEKIQLVEVITVSIYPKYDFGREIRVYRAEKFKGY